MGSFTVFFKVEVALELAGGDHNYRAVTFNKANDSDPQAICGQLLPPKFPSPLRHRQALCLVIKAAGSIGSVTTATSFLLCPSASMTCHVLGRLCLSSRPDCPQG